MGTTLAWHLCCGGVHPYGFRILGGPFPLELPAPFLVFLAPSGWLDLWALVLGPSSFVFGLSHPCWWGIFQHCVLTWLPSWLLAGFPSYFWLGSFYLNFSYGLVEPVPGMFVLWLVRLVLGPISALCHFGGGL